MGIEAEDSSESHVVHIGRELDRDIEIISGKNPELEDSFPHHSLEELGRNLAETRAEFYRDKTIQEHTRECKSDILNALRNGTLTAAVLDDEVISVGSIHPLEGIQTIDKKPVYMIGRASTIERMKGNGLYHAVSNQMMDRFNRLHDPYETPLMTSAHGNAVIFRMGLKEWKEIDLDNPPKIISRDFFESLREDVAGGDIFFIYDPEDKYYPPKK